MRRPYVSAVAGALVVLAMMASSVSAHECFVVNRSAQGNAGASRLERVVHAHARPAVFGNGRVRAARSDRRPGGLGRRTCPRGRRASSFTIRTDKTIGEDAAGITKNGRGSDGKGIDHFMDVYGETIIGIVFEAAGH